MSDFATDDEEPEIHIDFEEDAGAFDATDMHFSVDGLGMFHEMDGQDVYLKTEETPACLQDLLRFLINDSGPDKPAHKALAEWGTIKSHIIPLFIAYREDPEITVRVLKLLCHVTLPIQRNTNDFPELLRALQRTKEVFCTKDVLSTMMTLMMGAAETVERLARDGPAPAKEAPDAPADGEAKEGEAAEGEAKEGETKEGAAKEGEEPEDGDRHEGARAEKILEMSLVLFRNLLAVPDAREGEEGYTFFRGGLTVVLIKALAEEGILGVLGYMAEQSDHPAYSNLFQVPRVWHLLECFYYIVARLDPARLAEPNEGGPKKLKFTDLLASKRLDPGVPLRRHSRFVARTVMMQTRAVEGDNKAVLHVVKDPIKLFLHGGKVSTTIRTTIDKTDKRAEIKPATSSVLEVFLTDGTRFQPPEGTDLKSFDGVIENVKKILVKNEQWKIIGKQLEKKQRSKAFQNRWKGEQKNLMQDPLFVDLDLISSDSHMLYKKQRDRTPMILTDEALEQVRQFVDDFILSCFNQLMHLCFGAVGSGQAHESGEDHARIMNIMAWVLEYHHLKYKAQERKAKAKGEAADIIDAAAVQYAINLDAIKIVREKMLQHGKVKSKGNIKDWAWHVINLRTLAAQLKIAQVIVDSHDEDTKKVGIVIAQNLLYENTLVELEWLLGAYRSTSHDPRVMTYAMECTHRVAKLMQRLADLEEKLYVGKKRAGGKRNAESAVVQNQVITKDSFMEKLCKPPIIAALMYMVDRFAQNGRELNYFLGSLLYQICRLKKYHVVYFFQLTYLFVLQRVLDSSKERADASQFRDLTNFAKFVETKLSQLSKKNSWIWIDVVFPKVAFKGAETSGLTSLPEELQAIYDNFEDEGSRKRFDVLDGGESYVEMCEKALGPKLLAGGSQGIAWTLEADALLREEYENYKLMANLNGIVRILVGLIPPQPNRHPGAPPRSVTPKDVKQRLWALGIIQDEPGRKLDREDDPLYQAEDDGDHDVSPARWKYEVPHKGDEDHRLFQEYLASCWSPIEWEELGDEDAEEGKNDFGGPTPKRRRTDTVADLEAYLRADTTDLDDLGGLFFDDEQLESVGRPDPAAFQSEMERLLEEACEDSAPVDDDGLVDDLLAAHGHGAPGAPGDRGFELSGTQLSFAERLRQLGDPVADGSDGEDEDAFLDRVAREIGAPEIAVA